MVQFHFSQFYVLLVLFSSSVAISEIPQELLSVYQSIKSLRADGFNKENLKLKIEKPPGFKIEPLEVPIKKLNDKAAMVAEEILSNKDNWKTLQTAWPKDPDTVENSVDGSLVILRHAADTTNHENSHDKYNATWQGLLFRGDLTPTPSAKIILEHWDYNRMGAYFDTSINKTGDQKPTTTSLLVIVLQRHDEAFENYFRCYTLSLLGVIPNKNLEKEDMPLNKVAAKRLKNIEHREKRRLQIPAPDQKQEPNWKPYNNDNYNKEVYEFHGLVLKFKQDNLLIAKGELYAKCKSLLDDRLRQSEWKEIMRNQLYGAGFAFKEASEKNNQMASIAIIFQLNRFWAKPNTMPFTFFFGKDNPLSQMHPCTIIVKVKQVKSEKFISAELQVFNCAEQFMMYMKALLFNDATNALNIIKAKDPRDMPGFGRNVKNFTDDLWNIYRNRVVMAGSFLKYKQNKGQNTTTDLCKCLLDTKGTKAVEVNPTDKYYGIALRATDIRAFDPNAWNGLNTLGNTLTDLRVKYEEAISNNTVENFESDRMKEVDTLINEIQNKQQQTENP